GQGPRTAAFERAFAEAEGAAHAVATSSCTAALHLGVASLGAGPGDAVLVPTHAWVSVAEAVAAEGAVPVLVDCRAADQMIDLADAAEKLRRAEAGALPGAGGRPLRVRGMIAVYYGGLIPDEAALAAFAAHHGLWWIADAAHAFTADRQDTGGQWMPCGSGAADLYSYSFYPNKTITTGDGGMILTRDRDRADALARMRNHGLSADAWTAERLPGWDRQVMGRGFKYTMTDLEAALGLAQLGKARAMRTRRAAIAAAYGAGLAGLPGLGLPVEPAGRRSSWHLYPVRLPGGVERDAVLAALAAAGVDARVHWRPLHLQPHFAGLGWRAADCPVSCESWLRLVSLPIFPSMSEAQVAQVITALSAALAEQALPPRRSAAR
ncbi:MAG: aminotransferase class I/II-fold pyridoxal phosphate-dependent enzyme, partial [Pseudomonadota bacterium]